MMQRRLRKTFGLTFLAALTQLAVAMQAVSDGAQGAEPIRLSVGPHLFVDDYLVEREVNLTRTTHQPEKWTEPIVPKAESWHQQPLFFIKVIHDPQSGKYRMWYNVKNPGGAPGICYCYAESEDAVHWTRPNLGLVSAPGSADKNNNIIDAPQGYFGLFFVDDGPDCKDPARRYKMAYYVPDSGMSVAFSADGLRFQPFSGNPVIAADAGKPYDLGYMNVINDVIDGCWDPLRNQYLMGCKIEEGGYPGKPHYHAEGWRRTVGMSVSKDFIHWRRPWQIVLPDPNNGIEEFYGVQPMVRGTLDIGFLRVLRDDLPADDGGPVEGIGWTELITSRDGERWTRCQDKFLDRNLEANTWDHAMAWVGDCVTVDDKDYIYYGGYSAGHKVGDRQIGLAVLRKNGFVSRDAGAAEGFLRTPLVALEGTRLTVNADVKGEMRVRLRDGKGVLLPGFDWEDCAPIRGDGVAHPVTWKGSLADVQGKPVRLEFRLRDAALYGFALETAAAER